jgi:superoxide dismutase
MASMCKSCDTFSLRLTLMSRLSQAEYVRVDRVCACAGKTAILTMDVWEHAYYLDFQNARPGYINTYIDKLISWDKVAERYAAAIA